MSLSACSASDVAAPDARPAFVQAKSAPQSLNMAFELTHLAGEPLSLSTVLWGEGEGDDFILFESTLLSGSLRLNPAGRFTMTFKTVLRQYAINEVLVSERYITTVHHGTYTLESDEGCESFRRVNLTRSDVGTALAVVTGDDPDCPTLGYLDMYVFGASFTPYNDYGDFYWYPLPR
jgi:hypothetical protein